MKKFVRDKCCCSSGICFENQKWDRKRNEPIHNEIKQRG